MSAPSQPTEEAAFDVSGNPASKEPAQQAQSKKPAGESVGESRNPQNSQRPYEEAHAGSLGTGGKGPDAREKASDLTDQEKGVSADVEAEQMRAPGEGEVASAVKGPSKVGGGEPGLETDLDRKKAEQAPQREERKREQQKEVDVGGVLGQRGGPASTVS